MFITSSLLRILDPADRFATARPQYELPTSSAPPSSARPYGMRFLNPLGSTSRATPPAYTYDEAQQLALGADGQPLHLTERSSGPPPARRTVGPVRWRSGRTTSDCPDPRRAIRCDG